MYAFVYVRLDIGIDNDSRKNKNLGCSDVAFAPRAKST
jgi:hypothetical protein